MGYGCNQIMMSQWTWSQDTSCVCHDRLLSTWSTSDDGIATLPYYDYLDITNGLSDAVSVVNNINEFSLEDITIQFKYSYPTTTVSISSSNLAFQKPEVCNAVAQYTHTNQAFNVSLKNCGTASADFTFTASCINGITGSSASPITLAVDAVKTSWVYDFSSTICDSVNQATISTTPCPEFWNSTCSWTAVLSQITDPPTVSPTPAPVSVPTAAPVSFFVSCTSYQVVPVRGAVGNVIEHQELCLASKGGHYIVDINAAKPYYILENSVSISNTTINKINEDDYSTGADSGDAALGSALIGHSIIYIETWFDVLAYLGLDLSTYSSSQSITTSIKIDGLNISVDIPSQSAQSIFETNLKTQLVSELACDADQIAINGLRSGSIIADIEISSTTTNTISALELSVNLENYVANKTATSASVSSPLNTVNNYYYANVTNDIMFTDCPYRITATTWEGERTTVSWETPNYITNANNVVAYQAIGDASGESFAGGSYLIRYVALSSSDASVAPKYCSFVVVVEEKEWVIEFMGIEFSVTSLGIIGTLLFFICTGSIVYSYVMRRNGRGCCHRGRVTTEAVPSDNEDEDSDKKQLTKGDKDDITNGFKSVIVSSHDTTTTSNIDSPSFNVQRASAPILS